MGPAHAGRWNRNRPGWPGTHPGGLQSASVVALAGNTHPIQDYYQALGGSASYLSDPVGSTYQTPGGGMAQDYRGGAIYWSLATGAHAAHGAILDHYRSPGRPGSALGYP